ncbi:Alpha/Beta hydrolase protein [Chaetomium sp. MPI-SDFR-AT-0129]|nr:Alpha/Beta hydrolase protein [Chaetomium sp. MPI-SDFR-AT-0129]
MNYSTFTTTDNCVLAFQSSLPLATPTNPSLPPSSTSSSTTNPNTCILLLHGFSGSSAYFTRNATPLSSSPASHWVVCPDMRGHGRSGHNPSRGGFHVARLAADLRELLLHLRKSSALPNGSPLKVVPVGCSIGAAVVWTYLELFGETSLVADGVELAGYVFVDQAPLQDRAALGLGGTWDAGLAHRGCFDEETMLAAQRAWMAEDAGVRKETHRGLVGECLGYRFAPNTSDSIGVEEAERDEEFFTGISELCDGTWLARLLADHTRYDHREGCEGITKPVLVMAGKRSGCFSLEGMGETVKRAKSGGNEDAELMVFESGHWLFYEEPERFNKELLGFVERCTKEKRK